MGVGGAKDTTPGKGPDSIPGTGKRNLFSVFTLVLLSVESRLGAFKKLGEILKWKGAKDKAETDSLMVGLSS